MQKISQITKTKQALSIMVTNPLSLALLKAPADVGVDIVCGDGQPLGNNLNFGGSSFGFLAAKKEYLRQIPGRIIGKTVDKDNQAAYCLTLQTREQHIRREKATSNICSNQSLNAIAAAIYLALMGKQGIVDAALSSLNLTNYLCAQIKQINGIKVLFGKRFFNEFVWEIAGAKKIIDKLYKKNIIAGYWLGRDFPEMKNAVLSCCTETKTKKDIDDFVAQLKMVIEKM
jgi:glycine dehydrogenase subunit 1